MAGSESFDTTDADNLWRAMLDQDNGHGHSVYKVPCGDRTVDVVVDNGGPGALGYGPATRLHYDGFTAEYPMPPLIDTARLVGHLTSFATVVTQMAQHG